jgi:threonine dehydrogenase-like Zn-dependent dehydrogenase
MRAVHVVGGGPAGVMAAFAAMREGASVRIGSRLHHVARRAVEQSSGPSARSVERKSERPIELESCCGLRPPVRTPVNLLQGLTIES